ncbi:hypothetical protein M406DRAFT_101675 [Cryphonectria parasitica EP155]|uniref:Uncharacterized protein n=1 Tax=Cryphonectria parasitica (strain ATCC 38755 / EP155) TaxID=660469 RepID=A0A9P5CQE9_CRYP1|nr:uncharacterized protein M406DRAFT_101675 [Cryphonectria parasitica EP155]KAF3766367.1 hypothetical protein M406DRAFT_101675 [Cryphonectria parasitica EP155]
MHYGWWKRKSPRATRISTMKEESPGGMGHRRKVTTVASENCDDENNSDYEGLVGGGITKEVLVVESRNITTVDGDYLRIVGGLVGFKVGRPGSSFFFFSSSFFRVFSSSLTQWTRGISFLGGEHETKSKCLFFLGCSGSTQQSRFSVFIVY